MGEKSLKGNRKATTGENPYRRGKKMPLRKSTLKKGVGKKRSPVRGGVESSVP